MALADVQKEILQNAEKQAKELIDSAKAKEKEIMQQSDAELKAIEEAVAEETRTKVETLEKREVSQANLASRKMIMESKKKILDAAFEDAEEKISNMSEKKRKELLDMLIKNSEIDAEYVYCNKDDVKLVKAKKVLAKEMLGGLIIESKDKSVTLDYTYDTVLKEIRQKNLQQIANILF